MKKTSISIDMEAEKLRALRFYTEKKETTLETELEDFLAKLYEKYVPAQTREYIESMEEPAGTSTPPHQTPAPHSGRYAYCGERGGGVIGLCFYRTLAGQAPACPHWSRL